MNWLTNLFKVEKTEREETAIFKSGKEAGIEEGIRIGMAKNFERSTELTESEYSEVIDFLVERGLELCCYDIHRGGFSVRKRKYEPRKVNIIKASNYGLEIKENYFSVSGGGSDIGNIPDVSTSHSYGSSHDSFSGFGGGGNGFDGGGASGGWGDSHSSSSHDSSSSSSDSGGGSDGGGGGD